MRSNTNFKGYVDDTNSNPINGSKPPPPANLTLLSQPSIYSLTFDEFQSTIGGLGKDFGSMNMDELLKNIWTAEETQSLVMSSSSANDNTTIINNNVNNNYHYSNPNGNLQRQGSLTLPRTLSQKTVDEVWRDLMKDSGSGGGGANNSTKDNSGGAVPSASAMTQRQQTLGEMTLEEFFVRAGVVREDNNNVNVLQIGRPQNNNSSHQWFNNDNSGLMLGFQQPNGNLGNPNPMVNSNNPVSKQPPTLSLQGGGLTVAGSPTSQISPRLEDVTRRKGDDSLHSPVPYVINRPKKCGALEKVVERRQRRMIKNRESAARSRARKQAYTIELEAEVEKLKDLNRELKIKQAKFMEMQKNNNQALVTVNGAWGGKIQCLRRTLTGPW